jgi:murein DD-endopeptidase MepM/ murein hydrolase activator NlpD
VQGGIALCKSTPGAMLIVDGVERGAMDEDGWAVIGFDRDATARARVTVRNEAGAVRSKTYQIARRKYSVQKVDGLPPQTVNPTDPDVLEKIKRNQALKAEATKTRADAEGWLEGFQFPIKRSYRISGPWGNQRVLNGQPRPPHMGIDIAVPTGTPIHAPAGGVIALAEPDMHFEGGLVMLDHGQGLITYYLHMSRVDVRAGDVVKQGDVLGAVGATGRATGPHLCWRMRWRDRQMDPNVAVEGLAIATKALAP